MEQTVVSEEGSAIMPGFFSDAIEVIRDEETRNPISFIWRDKEYGIKEIIAFWPDFSYSESGSKRKRWWQRRHRNYYRILTEDEEVFEIYLDRGSKSKAWILYRKLE